VKTWIVTIPPQADFVVGSCKVGGLPVIPVFAGGVLTIDLGGKVLNEGDSLAVEYAFRAL
jgi:hypothetical protein